MEVATCKTCGRLFNVISRSKICPNCKAALEDKFQDVKKYLDENPNTSIEVLSKECEIPVKQIKDWIREERLAFSEDAQVGLECEGCGKMIRTGRFCEACKAKYINGFSAYTKPKEEPEKKIVKGQGPQMRFLDRGK